MLLSDRRPGFFVACMYCNTWVAVQAEFPLILKSWTDFPAPAGWEFRLFMDSRVSDKPEVHIVCPECCRLNDTDLEAFLNRTCRGRDLVQVDGVPTLVGQRRGF